MKPQTTFANGVNPFCGFTPRPATPKKPGGGGVRDHQRIPDLLDYIKAHPGVSAQKLNAVFGASCTHVIWRCKNAKKIANLSNVKTSAYYVLES